MLCLNSMCFTLNPFYAMNNSYELMHMCVCSGLLWLYVCVCACRLCAYRLGENGNAWQNESDSRQSASASTNADDALSVGFVELSRFHHIMYSAWSHAPEPTRAPWLRGT